MGVTLRDDGYGYRAKIGLVYIASSVVMEAECQSMAPTGVSLHTSRLHLEDVSLRGVRQLGGEHAADLIAATRLLAEAPLDSLVFGCTSGSFIGGSSYNRELTEGMRAAAHGIPVTTTATASEHALKALEAKRIAMLTPYVEAVGERATQYFDEVGFEVVAASHLGLDNDWAIGEISPQHVHEQAQIADRPGTDALFISCTNLRTIAVLDDLEHHLGKPVVSAIQASYWEALRLAGIRDSILDCGRLLLLQ